MGRDVGRQYAPTDDLRDIRAVLASGLSTPERMVMVSLISHRNGETGRMDPSLTTIAEEAGVGRSTAVRALQALESRGWIQRDRARDGHSRTRYLITVPTSPKAVLVPERDQSQSGTRLVPERDGGSPTAGPERTKERTKERTETISSLWSVWIEELGGDPPHPKLDTGKRRDLLARLLDEQLAQHTDPVDVFRRICRTVGASDHHMASRAYHLPESLFKNAERRERWTLAALNGKGPSGRAAPESRPFGSGAARILA